MKRLREVEIKEEIREFEKRVGITARQRCENRNLREMRVVWRGVGGREGRGRRMGKRKKGERKDL